MPTVSPTLLLVASLLLTLLPLATALVMRRRHVRRLRRLAEGHGWQLVSTAEPELARRLVPHLPAPGAAEVRVLDVLATSGAGAERDAVARVEYVLGSVRHRRDNTRVLRFHQDADGTPSDVTMAAPADRPWLEQYASLMGVEGVTGES